MVLSRKTLQFYLDTSGNIPRRGVVPKFSDLEVIALSAIAEAFGIDSENHLFIPIEPKELLNLQV